jgi:hypothetical protein
MVGPHRARSTPIQVEASRLSASGALDPTLEVLALVAELCEEHCRLVCCRWNFQSANRHFSLGKERNPPALQPAGSPTLWRRIT